MAFSRDDDTGSTARVDDVWICHNPGSKHHGEVCSDAGLDQCLVAGDNNRFCWLLSRADCESDLGLQWQINSCHYFE